MLVGRSSKVGSFSKSREQKETYELYERVRKAFEASPLGKTNPWDLAARITFAVFEEAGRKPSDALFTGVFETIHDLIMHDGLLDLPRIDFSRDLRIEESVALRNLLRHKSRFLDGGERSLERWIELTRSTFAGILAYLPSSALPDEKEEEAESFSVCLIALLKTPAEVLDRLFMTVLSREGEDAELFAPMLRDRLEENLARASGIDLKTLDSEKTATLPSQARIKNPIELVAIYLAGTPYEQFFTRRLPLHIPLSTRLEHTIMVASSGWGKTQALQLLISEDIGRHGFAVIDSQGDLIRKVSRVKHDADVILIDPTDVEFPVGLNLFDVEIAGTGADREAILNGTIALYEYIFGGLLGAELTQRQSVIFGYIARLLLSIPNATIHTLLDVFEHGERYREYMMRLTGTPRKFFETQFFLPKFGATKQQILSRMYGLLENQTFERMFSQKKNKIDLFEAMNSGKIVLINTAKHLLQGERFAIFGKFFVAMIAQAALKRQTIPESERRPFFVYIDEAHEYLDDLRYIETLVNQARKYRVGLVMAHQNMQQLSDGLRATIMGSTSIKFAGGLNQQDVRLFSQEMRVQPEFIESLQKEETEGAEWACWIRSRSAVKLWMPFGVLESMSQLSNEEYASLVARNRELYCVPASVEEVKEEVVTPSPAVTPAPIEEKIRLPVAPAVTSAPSPVPTPAEVSSSVEERVTSPAVEPEPRKEAVRPPPVHPTEMQLGRGGREHKYIQKLLKQVGEDRGFRATIEREIPGGSVDLSLEREGMRIACEISVTSTPEQELGNVRKCLAAGYDEVILLSSEKKQLDKLKKTVSSALQEEELKRVLFLLPDALISHLDELAPAETATRTVGGYKVKVRYQPLTESDQKARRQAIAQVILQSMKRMKDGK
jgi:hypothetical protein